MADDDWMAIDVQLPRDEGLALLAYLRKTMNFVEIDWCELQRPDFARAGYGPCPPRTDSGYTIAPFNNEPEERR
jgi:hypothetical protein